jgi:mRNA-degrading endonuclease toxin of MazEF toxin-antitoxin module
LHTVVSDLYNAAGGPTVLIAEIETGTRYRATAYATETDYGVVLADRVVWMPVEMLGEPFGRLTDAQRHRVIDQIVAVLRGV